MNTIASENLQSKINHRTLQQTPNIQNQTGQLLS